MRPTQPIARLLTMLVALSGCEAPMSATTVDHESAHPAVVRQHLEARGAGVIQTSDGQQHSYFFRIPAQPAPAEGRAVLIWLHGDGGTGDGFATGFYPFTDPDGAIVVTPSGTSRTWTHAASDLPGQPQDAQFLSLLIDRLVLDGVGAEVVDPRRIYVGGESRGAFMPYYLLLRPSTRDRLAAVAVNAGNLYCLPNDADCEAGPSSPPNQTAAPILHIHGTNDGAVPAPTATFHSPIDWSVDYKVFWPLKLWAQQNGCFAGDNASQRDDGVVRESFAMQGKPAALYDLSAWGPACTKYQLLLVTNGGHVIAQQHERIWQFLRSYELDQQEPPAAAPAEPPAQEPNPLPEAEPPPEGTRSPGFSICGGRLCDGAGHDFVMRGVNVPVVWYPDQALGWLDEIALTGANTVRLVWSTQGSTPVLHDVIARAVALHLVPIVELHDVTGATDAAALSLMAQYYIDELRDVLLEFEGQLLVNIANEWSGSDAAYHGAYRDAVDLLRGAGINHTLVIDANGYGQNADILAAEGPSLLVDDPRHNLLFSVHMYQEFDQPQHMLDVLNGAASTGLPLIVGEFGSPQGLAQGEPGPIPFQVLLEEADRLGIGYLAWVWTGFGNAPGSMDLSIDGSAAQLTSWGDAVVNGPSGISQTSRTASIFAAPGENDP